MHPSLGHTKFDNQVFDATILESPIDWIAPNTTETKEPFYAWVLALHDGFLEDLDAPSMLWWSPMLHPRTSGDTGQAACSVQRTDLPKKNNHDTNGTVSWLGWQTWCLFEPLGLQRQAQTYLQPEPCRHRQSQQWPTVSFHLRANQIQYRLD